VSGGRLNEIATHRPGGPPATGAAYIIVGIASATKSIALAAAVSVTTETLARNITAISMAMHRGIERTRYIYWI